MEFESKIKVKNRMIKKAASIWGVQPNEIESTFDPLISLLITACASEISKLSKDLANSRSRITEKFVELMTPETVYGARTAHAIAYTEPSSDIETITSEDQFSYDVQLKTNVIKNYFFSPLQKTKIIHGRISYSVCDTDVYEWERKSKSRIAFNKNTNLPDSTLYLGFKADSEKIHLKDTSIFFEILDVENRELFYNHLKDAKFYYNNREIEVSPGYPNSEQTDRENLESLLSQEASKTRNIENQTKRIYKKHFISISSNTKLAKQPKVPEELINSIDQDEFDSFEDLHWFKIVFPKIISNQILKNLFYTFNAFPVLNRKLESISYQLKDFINVLPLTTSDYFLDIKKIVNITGQEYKPRDSDDSDDSKGTFVLRSENVGKLDARKAREFLLYLIEQLKDESAAFSAYGVEYLGGQLNSLNQQIALLEKKVLSSDGNNDQTNYVSVVPYRRNETLWVHYWTTNGEDANQIKSGSNLVPYSGSSIGTDVSFLVTPTFQGKNNLTLDERLYAYRRTLLSRNRIVTKEDIKSACYEVFGKRIEHTKITKSFRPQLEKGKGMMPIIEISLYPNASVDVKDFEWDALKNNLLSILEEESTNIYPFNVIINE